MRKWNWILLFDAPVRFHEPEVISSNPIAWSVMSMSMVLALISDTFAKRVYFGFLILALKRKTAIMFDLWTLPYIPPLPLRLR